MRKTKLVFITLLLFSTFIAEASHVTVQRARIEASKILGNIEVTEPKGRSINAKADDNGYYLFNSTDGGFAVIASDDRLPVVLAYSTEGTLEYGNMSPSTKAILDSYVEVVSNLSPGTPTHSSWLNAATTGGQIIIPTANWGQGYPYNLECPLYNGERCLTGCSATALAIVMKHHGFPVKGHGEVQYGWNGTTLSYDFSRIIDWDNMLDEYTANASDKQLKAVSQLMFACGVMLNADYNSGITGANYATLVRDMYSYFSYDKDLIESPLSEMSDGQCIALIRNEIDSNRPLLVSGENNNGIGHAFVIDGIDSENRLHINWGWDGFNNGFFTFFGEGVNPDAIYGNNAVLYSNIKPGDEFSPGNFMLRGDIQAGGGCGLAANVENIVAGEPFKISIETVWNYGPRVETPHYVVALCDANGNIKERIFEGDAYHAAETNGVAFSDQMQVEVKGNIVHDDCIMLFVSEGVDRPLTRVLGEGGTPDRIPVRGNILIKSPVVWDVDAGVTLAEQPNCAIFGFTDYVDFCFAEDRTVNHIWINGTYQWGPKELAGFKDYHVPVSGNRYGNPVEVKIRSYSENDLRHEPVTVTLDANTHLRDVKLGCAAEFITDLKLSGVVTPEDFEMIRTEMFNLRNLDMSDAQFKTPGCIDGTIPPYALHFTVALDRIVLPENTTDILNDAFRASGITSIVLPEKVSYIGLNVFNGCRYLENVTVKTYNPLPISWCVFWGTPRETTGVLTVPTGYAERYRVADEWNLFSQIAEQDMYLDIESIESDIQADGIVKIFNLSGRLVYMGRERLSYPLPHGVYIKLKAGVVNKMIL